jgi:hypothetical protein
MWCPSPVGRQVSTLRAPLGVFRAVLIGVCALLSVGPSGEPRALLVLLPLAVGALLAYRSERFAQVWPYVGALLAASGVPFTGGGRSPLLPYLMASALTLGLTRGGRDLLQVSGAVSAVLLAGSQVPGVGPLGPYLLGSAEWVLLSLAVGLIPIWARRVVGPAQPDDYEQMRHLLEQVRNLTRHLPGSLDAASAAEALLQRCAKRVSFEGGAVIVHPGEGVFVPIAVMGVSRVPWRTPLADDGPLRQAWLTGRPARDSRREDIVGRRRGSIVVAVPVPSRDGPFALLVLESSEMDAFAGNVVDELVQLAVAAAPQLETAVLFEEVRLEASNEERDRLAREMHDGIAQELAVLGYQLDQLTLQAQVHDEALAEEVAGLRRTVTSLMSELRLSITDLRTTLRPARGLGAALSTYLPAVCSGRDISLNLSLHEGPFRLPVEQEAALLKSAQVFAQEVRRTLEPHEFAVTLVVDPPSAQLTLSCDAALPELRVEDIAGFLPSQAADVALSQADSETRLTITLKGIDDGNSAVGRRPRAHPAGTA